MTRQEANFKLLDELRNLIKANPNHRFGQILYNSAIVRPGIDPFFEESTDTLQRCFSNVSMEDMILAIEHIYSIDITYADGFHTITIINRKSPSDMRKISTSSSRRFEEYVKSTITNLYKNYTSDVSRSNDNADERGEGSTSENDIQS